MPPDAPLTLDRVLAAAEDVIRRFGPSKATVVEVARALGVSHTAVHKHVGSKAGLRDMVVGRWIEATMPPLRAIVAKRGPAHRRLRKLIDTLIAVKRRRAAAQAVQVLEVAAVHLGPGCGERPGAPVRAGEAEHGVPRLEEVLNDGRADEAGSAGDENAHGRPFR